MKQKLDDDYLDSEMIVCTAFKHLDFSEVDVLFTIEFRDCSLSIAKRAGVQSRGVCSVALCNNRHTL